MNLLLRDAVADVVEQATGKSFQVENFQSCHGGCIHQSGICSDGERQFFVKINGLDAESMFTAR